MNPTPKDLVVATLTALGYSYDSRTGWKLTSNGCHEKETPSIIASRIRNHLRAKGAKFVPCEKEVIGQLVLIQQDGLNNYNEICLKRIEYSADAKDTSEKLCRLICGDNFDPIYPSVLRQWLYQVKRKMNGEMVKGWVFPIFYGAGGVYKSTFIQALCSPLPEHKYAFIKSGDSLVNSESHTAMLHDLLIVHIDEMAGMGRADIAKLKTLDAMYVAYRPLYTNTTVRGYNRASLIGASNIEVRNILSSTDDIRKWVQINFFDPTTEEKTREIGEQIRAFDYLSLWKSINEKGSEPFDDVETYTRFRDYVRAVCTSTTPTTDWLETFLKDHAGEWIDRAELYDQYIEKCRTETKHLSRDRFYELCRKRTCRDAGRNGIRGFWLPSVAKPDNQDTF